MMFRFTRNILLLAAAVAASLTPAVAQSIVAPTLFYGNEPGSSQVPKQGTMVGSTLVTNVQDFVGVTTTGSLYQYSATDNALQEGMYRLGSNSLSGYSDPLLPPINPATSQAYPSLGTHVIKIWFDGNTTVVQSYPNDDAYGASYPNTFGASGHASITTLKGLAQSTQMKALFSDPDFNTYILEAGEFCTGPDSNGTYHQAVWGSPSGAFNFGTTVQTCVYDQFYDLTDYLLRTYSGTGKTFVLQNWEGDNDLAATSYTPNPAQTETCSTTPPTSTFCTSVQNMIAWLNLRENGVNDARRDDAGKYNNVMVAAAVEVNLVDGFPTGPFTNSINVPTVMDIVYPSIEMDLYSCSCYYADSNLANATGVTSPQPSRPQTFYNQIQALKSNIKFPNTINTSHPPIYPPSYSNDSDNKDKVYIGEFNSPEDHWYPNDQWGTATTYSPNTNSIPSDQAQRMNTGQELAGALQGKAKWVLYWQVYSNDWWGTPSQHNGHSIDGYWLIRPPCNSTDSGQIWCTSPPAGYSYFTQSWNALQNIMTLPMTGNSAYSNVYEAEDFFTSVTTPGDEVDVQSSAYSGDYATELEGAQVNSVIHYSMYVPVAGNYYVYVNYMPNSNQGIVSVHVNNQSGYDQIDMYGSGGEKNAELSKSGTPAVININGNGLAIPIDIYVKGKDASSSGYNLIIDSFTLVPAS